MSSTLVFVIKFNYIENCFVAMQHIKNKIFFLTYTRIAILLLVGSGLFNIFVIQNRSVTYDEPYHYRYGWQILKEFNSDKFFDGLMPFTCLNTTPRIFHQDFNFKAITDYIQKGRYITILFSIILGWFVFKWAKDLYGELGAIFSLLLYILCPNIIAHSGLVTTDLYATCMMTISLYYFWLFTKFGKWKYGILCACALGFAQLTKYSLLFLYLIFGIIIVIEYTFQKSLSGNIQVNRSAGKRIVIFIITIIVTNVLIINAGFLFNRSCSSFSDYQFKSRLFTNIDSNIGWLRDVPVPLPYPYIEGIDQGMYNDQSGEGGYGNIYLLGKTRKAEPGYRGFYGYYLIACMFKVPIATQLFIFLAIFLYILQIDKALFVKNEMYLLLPVIFYAVFFNCFFKRQIGIRHFLIIFPLLYIFCGSLFTNFFSIDRKKQISIVCLYVYLLGSVLSYYPHYISYFNELVWDRKYAYKILADSNIDWGQSDYYLKKYVEKRPNVYINPQNPVEGEIVISVNNLVGVNNSPLQYKWLRDWHKPIGHIGYSFLIYDTSKKTKTY